MQTDKLYPTSSTTTDGIQLTDHLQDISGFADTMADAYLMGYISGDKMPAAFMPVYLSGGAGEMSAIYKHKNAGWGYTILDNSADQRRSASFTNVNGNIVIQPSDMGLYRFINAAQMACANTGMQIVLTVTFAFIDDSVYDGDGGTNGFIRGGTYAGGWGASAVQTFSYTFEQYANIIKNDLPLFSVTRTGNSGVINGKSFTFEPKPSEFGDSNDVNEDHKYNVDSGLGARAVVFINGYIINASMAYANGDGGLTNYYLRPFTYQDIDEVESYSTTKSIIIPSSESETGKQLTWDYNASTNLFTLVPGSTGFDSITDYNVFPGGFNFGTLRSADIDFTAATAQIDLLVKKSIWMNATHYGSTIGGYIHAHYTPMDIYRHALLYHKHTTDGTLTTYSNDTWVTKFNTKNEPSDTIVSGELSDIKLDLQPWQYPEIDITVNTFTPKNIPDSSDTGTNLIRFGNITPSEFLFGDVSIEKIYFGSSLLYQKFVPEQYVKLIPTDKFTIENTSVDDYRIYGELPAGDIVLSVRTPRTKNLLPYPYPGIYYHSASGSERWQKSDNANFTFTDNGDGTYDVPAQTTQNWKTIFQLCGSPHYDEHPGILIGQGAYMMSFRIDNPALSDNWPQLEICCISAETGSTLLNTTDLGSYRHTGRIQFSVSERCYIHARLYLSQNIPINAHTIVPQLELGSTVTEYEPPNDPTLTTITLPRALEENEYISYADQKIMPTGTPLVVPKLKTKVGENVIMIENYPTATNTITLTPATKE